MAEPKQPTGMENFNTLKEMIDNLADDASKCFEKGNKAAGVRLRTTMQTAKQLMVTIRKQSLEAK